MMLRSRHALSPHNSPWMARDRRGLRRPGGLVCGRRAPPTLTYPPPPSHSPRPPLTLRPTSQPPEIMSNNAAIRTCPSLPAPAPGLGVARPPGVGGGGETCCSLPPWLSAAGGGEAFACSSLSIGRGAGGRSARVCNDFAWLPPVCKLFKRFINLHGGTSASGGLLCLASFFGGGGAA